jgi:epsilon-lactone hydrolase
LADLTRLKAALRAHRPADDLPVDAIRARMAADARALPVPDGVEVRPGEAGGVPVEVLTPTRADTGSTLVYLHGGGYCAGSARSVRGLCARLALAASARVVAVDYRLAPEHPFPAARDDALAVFDWLLDSGTDPATIAVGGDSAGGGLTVATMVSLRDRGGPLPSAGFCLSPWADLRLTSASIRGNAEDDPIVSPRLLERFADWYAGGDPDAGASPVHAELAGLPRLLIQAGDQECLADDATALAQRARSHGVPVELELWPDVVHVWHLLAPRFAQANRAIERIAEWLREPGGDHAGGRAG